MIAAGAAAGAYIIMRQQENHVNSNTYHKTQKSYGCPINEYVNAEEILLEEGLISQEDYNEIQNNKI